MTGKSDLMHKKLPENSERSTENPRAMVRIVHFTTVHGNRDVRIFVKQCRSLASAGYNVVQIAPGLGGEQMVDGVRCIDLPIPPTRLGRATAGQSRMLRKLLATKADVYQFHDPELIFVGLLLRLLGRRVVFDSHEHLEADIYDKPWIPARLRRPVAYFGRIIELVAGKMFNAIVAATPGIAAVFPKKKTVLVQNFPVLEEIEPETADDRDKSLSGSSGSIVFLGLLNDIRGGFVIAEAMRQVTHPEAKLEIVGQIPNAELVKALEPSEKCGRVVMHGWKDRDEALSIMRNARAGLLLYLPVRNHLISLPNKLFEYMAAGIPLIATNFSHWEDIIDESGCGWTVDPNDPAAIAAAVDAVYADPVRASKMGIRGIAAVRKHFNWDMEFHKLDQLYLRILGLNATAVEKGVGINIR